MKEWGRKWTVKKTLEYLKKEKLIIDRPFLRKSGLWAREWQSLLITNLLEFRTLHHLSFEKEGDKYLLIDGKQRLTSLADFVDGKFRLKLAHDDVYVQFNGKKFEELPDDIKEQLLDSKIEIVFYEGLTEYEVRRRFLLLNTPG
jgi:hypothetical protein